MSASPTEKEKMLAGQPYNPNDAQLWADRVACRRLLSRYIQLDYDNAHDRQILLAQLLGSVNPASPPFLEPPFFCDYGYNIAVGDNFYANFNCTILDCGAVKIGNRCLFGPSVSIYTVSHPVDPRERNGAQGPEFTAPVVIHDDVFIGGGAIILPGVTVGEGSTVGAGAVVVSDVDAYCVVAGNPAKVIRTLPRP